MTFSLEKEEASCQALTFICRKNNSLVGDWSRKEAGSKGRELGTGIGAEEICQEQREGAVDGGEATRISHITGHNCRDDLYDQSAA
jgi:hypothetical protein